MNVFAFLVRPSGAPVDEATRQQFAACRVLDAADTTWAGTAEFLAATRHDQAIGFCPELREWDSYVGVGNVRLDNRGELTSWLKCHSTNLSDFEIVLRLVAETGVQHIPHILGDFAFVIWNRKVRWLIAARDALGVRKLYYTERRDLLAFASRAEVLATGETYDVQYLSELLSYCDPTPDLTVYSQVRSIPAAGLATAARGKVAIRRYWSAYDFQPEVTCVAKQPDVIEELRDLLIEAITTRMTPGVSTWAHLSGGLDSSCVVSVAQWLFQSGRVSEPLSGTITWTNAYGTGADEREYSHSVVQRYRVHNRVLDNFVWWRDDEIGPPMLDQPNACIQAYAQDRRVVKAIQAAGGRVLLTGLGGDNLLTGNMFFFADWLRAGHISKALHEMARRSAIGRVSFWELAYKSAVLPLLPPKVQRLLIRELGCAPSWINPRLVSQFDLQARSAAFRGYAGRRGHKYTDAVAYGIDALPSTLADGLVQENLDVRHPYLYRPLVEFALRLSPEMCVQPQARKWVLREAMRGILPDLVRTRVGKGTTYGMLAQGVVGERPRLERMVSNPILGELGCIDTVRLRDALRRCQYESDRAQKTYADVQYTLGIEAWLQVRSGRWAAADGTIVTPELWHRN